MFNPSEFIYWKILLEVFTEILLEVFTEILLELKVDL